MKKIINPQMTLFAVGVLQPTRAAELRGFLARIFGQTGAMPEEDEYRSFLMTQANFGRLVLVTVAGEPYFSLTNSGNLYLPPNLRKTRDKFRAYLLRDAHRGRYIESRDAPNLGLAGASPAVDTRSGVKGRAANKLVLPAFGRRKATGQAYWPRIQGQFSESRTGPSRPSRDTFPSLLSFETAEHAAQATERPFSFDYLGLGLCLGLSGQLIWTIARDTNRHYRTFEIGKKSGGTRLIESPRVFLKVIQWFLADFVLTGLRCHSSVHSFVRGRSIATNGAGHEQQAFVANIDIENFFGSITSKMVKAHLELHGFNSHEADLISKLCTNFGSVPQGAPTSPLISNSILYGFDSDASILCEARGLRYSRYADDITISGRTRQDIQDAVEIIATLLGIAGFTLNQTKTRIASKSGQQRVTGVVVNTQSSPPRLYRRKARAAFHQAQREPSKYAERVAELGGIIGYLKMFPKLTESNEVRNYERVLTAIKNAP